MTKKILLATTLSAVLLSVTACSDKKEEKVATSTAPKMLVLPKVSKAEVSTLLDLRQADLVRQGFAIEKKGDTYTLGLADEQKARAYLFQTIKEALPSSYVPLLNEMKYDFINENKGAFEGTNVTFTVIEDAEGAKVKVTLSAIPSELEKELDREIARDKQTASVAKQFKALVAKGAFSYMMTLTKEGKVTSVTLADFKETFSMGTQSITLASKGLSTRLLGDTNSSFQMQGSWNSFLVGFILDREGNGSFGIDNVFMNVEQKDRFNAETSFSVDGIHFDLSKERFIFDYEKDERKSIGDETTKFSIKGIRFGSTSKSNAGFVDIDSAFNIGQVLLSEKSAQKENTMNIDGYSMKASLSHIATKPLEDLVRFIDTFSGELTQKEQRQLANIVEAISQAGFSIGIDTLDLKAFSINAAGMKAEVHDLHFAIKATLPKNDVLIDDFMQLLPLVEVSGQIAMNEAEYNRLKEKQPNAFGMPDQFKKVENGRVIFDASYNKGLLLINGKSLNGSGPKQ